MIPACPHCGDSENGFIEHGQMRGPCSSWFGNDGNYKEQFWDETYSVGGGVVRCGSCNKIRRDLEVSGAVVRVKS